MGCDAGPKDFEQSPPALNLVGSNPAPEQGTDCSSQGPEDCGVPIDTDITFRFDRYILPSTAVRQSFVIYTGSPANAVPIWEPYYDIVERVVHFEPPSGQVLEPGTLYTIELRSAETRSEFGFRAFDGAPLADGGLPIQFNFRTRRSEERSRTVLVREPVDCGRALEIFSEAGCATQGCHGGQNPAMGLLLDSVKGLVETAISKVAHQTERGAESGVVLRDPTRFGIQMPVIDPGQPGNSYVLYKLLRNPLSHRLSADRAGFCETRYSAELGDECLRPSEQELARLREWFVLGSAMPRDAPGARAVYRDELDELARFIAAGADCR